MILTKEQINELADRIRWAVDLSEDDYITVLDNIEDYVIAQEGESDASK